jgi:predicted site-specific integrase-resolvase
MIEQFLNQARLADRWQISPRTLERWRWKGEGPAFVKIGGRVVYRLDDILAFETARRCDSTATSTRLRKVQ